LPRIALVLAYIRSFHTLMGSLFLLVLLPLQIIQRADFLSWLKSSQFSKTKLACSWAYGRYHRTGISNDIIFKRELKKALYVNSIAQTHSMDTVISVGGNLLIRINDMSLTLMLIQNSGEDISHTTFNFYSGNQQILVNEQPTTLGSWVHSGA
jgi:hypothetical protein